MRAFFTVSILLLASAAAFAEDPSVVLAVARAMSIEFYSATLGKLGAVSANGKLESVAASPDGRMLYLARDSEFSSNKCCGLYSLDLTLRNMCFLTAPAMFGLPSPDGNYLLTQGAQGVEVFDRYLNRLATMRAPGTYNLQPSPDGQWLLGVTNSPNPSLDIFDMGSMTLARRLPIPAGPVTGAWAGDRFYMFHYDYYGAGGIGRLWNVNPAIRVLEEATPVQLPDLYNHCRLPMLLTLAGARDKLFLAEAFGFKVDRRDACPDEPLGGIFEIQVSTGHVSHIAGSVQVNRMVVTPDGRDLYAIQSSRQGEERSMELVHIDTLGGHTTQIRLQSGVRNLALTHIPPGLIPRDNARVFSNCAR
jgi:hypothetical protein